ncbi:Gamma-glutamylputrescine oxidoreductase [Termitomyces sp. T112]|nr:Gamma-glutamylputrescine oxidoreductase [Termitomyces sp. T112]
MSAIHNAKAIFDLPAPPHTLGLPVPHSTHSFWINSPGANPLAKEGSEDDLTPDSDICIIGSGITGVSAAYHLARSLAAEEDVPCKVTILEARDFCSGATGRNGGHLTAEIFDNFVFRESNYGPDEAKKAHKLEIHTERELVRLIKAEGWEEIVDLVSNHRVGLLVNTKEMQATKADYDAAKAAQADLIENVEWLTEEEVLTEYGSSYPAYRHPGNNVWPLKLVTQLYKLAKKLNPNLNLHTNTPVKSISLSAAGPHRWTLSTPRGNIQCSYVIHATNAYASHLLPHLHGPKGIIQTRGQAIALRSAAPSAELTQDAWVGTLGWKYWFPRPVSSPKDKPLIIFGGGRDESGPGLESYIVDDATLNPNVSRALRKYLPPLFPGKYEEGREPEMEWTGIMGYTQVGDPFVGPVIDPTQTQGVGHYQGQYISAGYTGHGMPRGYACAEAVVGMITADIAGRAWSPPEWFPHHFLTTERCK